MIVPTIPYDIVYSRYSYFFKTYSDLLIKLSLTSQFTYTYFNRILMKLKNKIYLRIQIAANRRRKIIKLKNKIFSINLTSNLFTKTLVLKKFKLRKITIKQPYNYIIKSRRLLRQLFSEFKIRSKKLTTILIDFFKKKKSTYSTNGALLGFSILGFGFVLNLLDSYYFIKNKFILLNNKIVTSFFLNLQAGDYINSSVPLFFSSYFFYFKLKYSRWLNRKKRKNALLLRKYVNINKISTNVNKILRRWLNTNNYINNYNLNCEVDYQLPSIFCFSNSINSNQHFLYNNLSSSLGILNLWYYSF